VIGDGPELGDLRERAPTGVEFLGHVSRGEVVERLARAHVLVATSVREGWGLNVSEAAACGTPTIGYAVPGLVDSIPASGGILVPPSSAALGQRLVDFFSGSLSLTPRASTVPWATVADAVEAKLERVIHAAGRG
jgi:glycosyltransferase involved in cell wall biosynthesis